MPAAREVAPWLAAIERLWDDPEFEARHRQRARVEAQRWDGQRLAGQYELFLRTMASSERPSPRALVPEPPTVQD